jgi:hypothetical protein
VRAVAVLAVLAAVCGTAAGESPKPRLLESAAASVNGEVIFLSDVVREACYHRCGIVRGRPAEEISLAQARERLVMDTLVLQEQRRLGLGTADNAALAAAVARAAERLAACPSPCARSVNGEALREHFLRKDLVRDFLAKRLSVFVEVGDEEVRREVEHLRSRGAARPEDLEEGKVRKELFERKSAAEIRNWYERTASKSRILLSPLAEQ